MTLKYRYSKDIENDIKEGLMKGASLRSIFASVQHRQECPRNLKTFLTKYEKVIDQTKLEYQYRILDRANERIDAGSERLIEMALKSKAGWNPAVKVEEKDPDEPEDNDAVSTLLEILNKRSLKRESDNPEADTEEESEDSDKSD